MTGFQGSGGGNAGIAVKTAVGILKFAVAAPPFQYAVNWPGPSEGGCRSGMGQGRKKAHHSSTPLQNRWLKVGLVGLIAIAAEATQPSNHPNQPWAVF
jgi:hypothetical protein